MVALAVNIIDITRFKLNLIFNNRGIVLALAVNIINRGIRVLAASIYMYMLLYTRKKNFLVVRGARRIQWKSAI